jgi:hypothetical protein
MNMDINITQYIDLESYSSTPGFLGYTDNAPDFSEAGIDALCDDFLKKMAAYINDVTVVSSLFISSNKEELSTDYDISLEKIDKFLHALLKNGMVKIIDLDTLSDPDSPQFDQEFLKLENDCGVLYTPDTETLKNILRSFFCAVGLNGHIFLVFRAAELIVYPHTDDLGFGFISMLKNKDRQQEQTEWLQKCFYNFQSLKVKSCPSSR